MYGALSELLYLCDLEEQRSREWGGFKAIIWVGGTNFFEMELTPLDIMFKPGNCPFVN